MMPLPPAAADDTPGVRLLSNGRYTVMLTRAGAGSSRWRELAVTRWREDAVGEGLGSHVLLRDTAGGPFWSATARPCGDDSRVAAWTQARAEFVVHRPGPLVVTLSVAVAGGCDAELRCVTIANDGDRVREIELTSYAELVLGPAAADAAHPAFSKMFVQTEWTRQGGGMLLATRRRRAPDEPEAWAAHLLAADVPDAGTGDEFETDRARFLGRGRTLRDARAMEPGARLSNTTGSVLDPVFSLRRRVRIAPGGSERVAFWTVVADSREAVVAAAAALRSMHACERAFADAAAHVQASQARFGVDDAQAARAARLAAPLLIADARWRALQPLARAGGGAPVLWAKGISGDRPIALLRVADAASIGCADELLRAQLYWRTQRLGADVVLLNTAPEHAVAALQGLLEDRVAEHRKALLEDADAAKAEVFALRCDAIGEALQDGLAAAARVVLDASGAGLEEPRAAAPDGIDASERGVPWQGAQARASGAPAPPAQDSAPLEFDNGCGGFAAGGREYEIRLDDGACTPAPWVNVVANPSFGFIVSAEGGGYTWSVNSQQNPLTPWPNDPVSDVPHEILYLRDEDAGESWSVTALPMRVPGATYRARHGKGFSRFTSDAHGIDAELRQFVPIADPVKLSRLRLRNRSGRRRRLSVTAYVEWALGANGTVPAPFVVTSLDAASGALFARNAWRSEFGERVAFIDLGGLQRSWTGDRGEFLGVSGAVDRPAALAGGTALSGRVGAGLDPCGALQALVELAPETEVELVFVLGDAPSAAAATALVETYRGADLDAVLREARASWDELLDCIQVRTPDRAMDILLNDWLPYQVLACRVWARTAYYQASGAYGFRDQLQDVMALCVSRPDVVREHLLRAAARQFVEGDVQHWWLPPSGQGIRTRMTDDRAWLAYVVADYVAVTADARVLDEVVPFLDGAPLAPGQDEAFFQPAMSDQSASLYEHCARALDVSLSLGAHGLPLIGTGDWNDGMNRVGEKGRGESVWLGWFLIATIGAFVPLAEARGDRARATRWREWSRRVSAALEDAGWDGSWYRRGYYDDGTPLGSATSGECRIDAIAQSWSVMSGMADPAHATQAMAAVEQHLIWRDVAIAPLFTPPFDRTPLDPGYIKGYPPGIRENGGQYTHGSIWSIFAFSLLGQGDQAGALFSILNPIHHGADPAALACYKVEPYVACADVYSVAPHVGRGGWTWYTGSAGWLYRAGIEAVLGLRRQGGTLVVDPCIPTGWPGYEVTFRYRNAQGIVTRYEIAVENPHRVSRGVVRTEVDGIECLPQRNAAVVTLADDGQVHRVRVVLARPPGSR